MLRSVSWQQYMTVVIVLSLVYYAVVALVFYRTALLSSLQRMYGKDRIVTDSGWVNTLTEEEQHSALEVSVRKMLEDLSTVILKASHQDAPREELIMALQVKLREYKNIKGTQFQKAIAGHIREELSAICNIDLDDFEMNQLW